MKKKYFYLILIISILGFGINCGKDHTKTQSKHQSTDQSTELKQADNTKKVRVKGQGGKRLGRKFRARSAQGKALQLTPEEAQNIDLKVETVGIRKMDSLISATGKVNANENKVAIVGPIFSGRIKSIYVNVGDLVQKESKLVILESLEVAEAKSEFYKTYASMELAKINYERQQRLFKENVAAQKNLAASEADYKIALANLNAAEKNLHTLGFNEEDIEKLTTSHEISPTIYLSSPIKGRVVKREAVVGAMVDQSNDLFTIMDLSTLWVDADIYERDLSLIKIGGNVEVIVPSYPREVFMGKVAYISDLFNEETRTATVRTEVTNRGSKLKVGMFANIKIYTTAAKEALVIPVKAVLDVGGEKIVFVKEGKSFRLKIVETGVTLNNFVEILSGLKEGEEVVVEGNSQILSELIDKETSLGIIH